jgi:hypothetical protein
LRWRAEYDLRKCVSLELLFPDRIVIRDRDQGDRPLARRSRPACLSIRGNHLRVATLKHGLSPPRKSALANRLDIRKGGAPEEAQQADVRPADSALPPRPVLTRRCLRGLGRFEGTREDAADLEQAHFPRTQLYEKRYQSPVPDHGGAKATLGATKTIGEFSSCILS